MKKFLAAAVVTGLIGGSAFAVTNVVSSANIVGYVKTDLAAGQIKIVAPQFLAGSTNGCTLGSISGAGEEDMLYTWDGSAYASYVNYVGYGWYDLLGNDKNDVVIRLGNAVWLQSKASASVTMSGDVSLVGSITNTLVEGINLVANPYPVALTLGNISSATLADDDMLFVWDGSTYASYVYYVGYGWYDLLGNDKNDVEIPVGQGFWLQNASSGSLILNKQF